MLIRIVVCRTILNPSGLESSTTLDSKIKIKSKINFPINKTKFTQCNSREAWK